MSIVFFWNPENLETQVFGKPLLYYSLLDSTNEYLLRKLKKTKRNTKKETKREKKDFQEEFNEELKEGLVVLAEKQSKGRGRFRKTWFSQERKSLAFSILLVPNRDLASFVQIPQITALSICQVLEKFYGLKPQIKWPNDVLLRNKKITGILCETIENRIVLGIGINVLQEEEDFPLELRDRVSSLFIETNILESNISLSREFVLSRILLALESNYQKWQNPIRFSFREYFQEQIRDRFFLYKKRIRIKTRNVILEGKVRGLDENGFLLLENYPAILSGEILSSEDIL